ncbi:MAG: acyltransferase domain-containing protein, partial [Mycobacteriaceae bacterium]|nr:acyltransferase domain-containing protein [Mycobacteriaceae bacterium]
MSAHRLPDNRVPVLLSAHEEDLIGQDAAAILDYLKHLDGTEDPTEAVAAALLRTRRMRRHRAVVRAAGRPELEAGLRALATDTPHPLVARSPHDAAARTAFVFPGQGNQWPSMGAEAYERLSVYRAEAQRCAEAFATAGLPSPLSYLLADVDHGWSQIDIQGAHFTHAASLARLWQSCGVLPDMTVGHSLGEVAAAYVAGTITLPDAVAVVAARATVVGRLPGRYGMALLAVGVDQAEQLIAKTPGWLEVSVVNSPSSSVVSGEQDAVTAVVRLAEEQSIFSRLLPVDFPAHTSKLESLRGAMADLLPASAFLEAPVEFVNSAHGGLLTAGTDFVEYWYQNLRNTVRFDEAVRTAVQRGAGRFVEMSAHPALHYALGEGAQDAVIVGSGRRDESVVGQLSANIAAAAVADADYRWSGLVDVTGQRLLRGFPTAPMRAIHLWATPEPLPPVPGAALTVVHEEWEPRPDNRTAPSDRPVNVAVVAAEGADDSLAHRLTEAVAAHHGCHLTDPDEAEIAVVIAPALVTPHVLAAVDQIRYKAGSLDYRAAVGSNCRRVWLITTGAEQVDPDSSAGLPAQAALAAMHRSVGFEFPDRVFAQLDLPSGGIDAQAAHRCVDMLLGDHTEVALRDSGCFVRNLRECAEPANEGVLDTAPLDNVVITGGGGTIGLRYARHCIERGARRVILLGR